ncbi:MAG: METTL5 family protein [Pyrobaculum sp.]
MFRSRKELELFVESIPTFKKPKLHLEQYPTDAALVATAVWDAHMRGLLHTVLDLGCGTGRFAISAAATGATYVLCVDIDPEALLLAKRAAERFGLEAVDFLTAHVARLYVRRRFSVVFQNPPFGIWGERGVDISFLKAAVTHGEVVYTIHKLATLDHIKRTVERWGLRLEVVERSTLAIKPMYRHHRKRIHRVEVFLAVVKT